MILTSEYCTFHVWYISHVQKRIYKDFKVAKSILPNPLYKSGLKILFQPSGSKQARKKIETHFRLAKAKNHNSVALEFCFLRCTRKGFLALPRQTRIRSWNWLECNFVSTSWISAFARFIFKAQRLFICAKTLETFKRNVCAFRVDYEILGWQN